MKKRQVRARKWRAPASPRIALKDVRRFSVTVASEEFLGGTLLHLLAMHGAISAEQADACRRVVSSLTPDPTRHVLFNVDLDLPRNTILEQLTWYVDHFQTARKETRPVKQGGRPFAAAPRSPDRARQELLATVERMKRLWPQVKAATSRDDLRWLLTKALWPRATQSPTAFAAADMLTAFTSFDVPVSEKFKAAVDSVVPLLVARKVRKPETCVYEVWAQIHGVDPRTIKNLYRKEPSSN